VLEALAAAPDGLGIRDTSRRTGIDKSVVSRLLTQLEALSMATKEEVQGRYHVGPRLFALSSAIVARDSLSRAARPILETLVRRFNETCYLATRHLDTFTFSAKVECTRPIRYIIELGSTAHLHAGAAGRAILLGMPEDEARAILQTTELEQLTDRTATDVERLLQLAAEDQTRGWSFSHGERMEGATAVAAPFFDAEGDCRGSVVFTRPAMRHTDDLPVVGEAVVKAAAELSQRLGWTQTGRHRRVGCPLPELVEDPGDLDGARRECGSAGPSRPRTIALADPRRSEPDRLLGHGHIERTLKPEGDGAALGDVRGDDLHQVVDLGAAAVSLDPVPNRIGTRPAEAVIRDGADVGAVDR
jgi:DNA-binding IclR family transcriptional regulator